MNLIKVLVEIKSEISRLQKEKEDKIKEIENTYSKKISDLVVAFNVNKEMNTACLRCEGTGKIEEGDNCGYESRIHKITCPDCNGTGLIQKTKK